MMLSKLFHSLTLIALLFELSINSLAAFPFLQQQEANVVGEEQHENNNNEESNNNNNNSMMAKDSIIASPPAAPILQQQQQQPAVLVVVGAQQQPMIAANKEKAAVAVLNVFEEKKVQKDKIESEKAAAEGRIVEQELSSSENIGEGDTENQQNKVAAAVVSVDIETVGAAHQPVDLNKVIEQIKDVETFHEQLELQQAGKFGGAEENGNRMSVSYAPPINIKGEEEAIEDTIMRTTTANDGNDEKQTMPMPTMPKAAAEEGGGEQEATEQQQQQQQGEEEEGKKLLMAMVVPTTQMATVLISSSANDREKQQQMADEQNQGEKVDSSEMTELTKNDPKGGMGQTGDEDTKNNTPAEPVEKDQGNGEGSPDFGGTFPKLVAKDVPLILREDEEVEDNVDGREGDAVTLWEKIMLGLRCARQDCTDTLIGVEGPRRLIKGWKITRRAKRSLATTTTTNEQNVIVVRNGIVQHQRRLHNLPCACITY